MSSASRSGAMAESSERSSRASASTGGGGGGGGPVEVSGSPVPYRIGPLAYLPPVYCKCESKAPRWISWSLDNPGRRYYRCIHANTQEDCGFFEWVDPAPSKWMKELLLDLKAVVFRLKRERGSPVVDEVREQHFKEVEQFNQSLQRQLVKKEEELEGKNMQLVKKEEDLEAMEMEPVNKHEELMMKDAELVKKDAELMKKDEELELKQKQLQALEAKMKGMKNGCTSCCGFMCVFFMGLFFALLFTGRSN